MAGNVFTGGKGLFTAWDPGSALRVNPPPTWVAVLPDKVTPELAQAFKDRGIALVIWEPEASQAGVDAVNRYGAAGYIAQAEGPEQLNAANEIGGQIRVPKALVTNNFMSQYPPGWIAMPEAYTNNDPNATPDQMTRDAKARGATEVVPVIGLGFVDTPDGRHISIAEYQAGLDRSGAAGATGSAVYISESAQDSDLNAYTSGKVPSGTGSVPRDPPGGGQQGQGQGQAQPPSPPKLSTPTEWQDAIRQWVAPFGTPPAQPPPPDDQSGFPTPNAQPVLRNLGWQSGGAQGPRSVGYPSSPQSVPRDPNARTPTAGGFGTPNAQPPPPDDQSGFPGLPPGFGTQPSGFGTQPGFGTPPAGGFGTPNAQPTTPDDQSGFPGAAPRFQTTPNQQITGAQGPGIPAAPYLHPVANAVLQHLPYLNRALVAGQPPYWGFR